MLVYNSSNNELIFDKVNIADNFITRSIGLILKDNMKENEVLIIKPCCSIHTFLMKFPIDVIFVDKNNTVLAIYENVHPNKILPIHVRSAYVLETKAQNISQRISVKETLEIRTGL